MPSQREHSSLGVWRDYQWVARVAVRTRDVGRRMAGVRIQSEVMANGGLFYFAHLTFEWDSDGYLVMRKVK